MEIRKTIPYMPLARNDGCGKAAYGGFSAARAFPKLYPALLSVSLALAGTVFVFYLEVCSLRARLKVYEDGLRIKAAYAELEQTIRLNQKPWILDQEPADKAVARRKQRRG